jgi:hypothetical protein
MKRGEGAPPRRFPCSRPRPGPLAPLAMAMASVDLWPNKAIDRSEIVNSQATQSMVRVRESFGRPLDSLAAHYPSGQQTEQVKYW